MVLVEEKFLFFDEWLYIKYDLQLGLIVLPKTTNVEHMKSNADVDFTISDDDMEILKHLNRIKDYGKL